MAEITSPTFTLPSRLSLRVPVTVNWAWPETTRKGLLLALAVSTSVRVRTTPSMVLRTVELSRAICAFFKSSSA